jgi:enoyl-CoA hydratase/carnithine racemase
MSTQVKYVEQERFGVVMGHLDLSSDSGVNPLSLHVVETLREHMAATHQSNAPHLLLLTAQGRCFSAGADVKEFRGFDEVGFRNYMARVLALYAEMIEASRPIVCAVHADARGGGAALALCSDFVVAQRDARFALPESLRGLAGGGYLMPRLIGKQMAAEMVLLGRDFSAEEMHGLGAVNALCSAQELELTAAGFCERLAAIPVSAFVVGKRSLAGGLSTGLREAMQWHVDAQTQAFTRARAEGRV